MRYKTSALSWFCATQKLGFVSHPMRNFARREKDTEKHPSPSANPEMYAGRFCFRVGVLWRLLMYTHDSNSHLCRHCTVVTKVDTGSIHFTDDFPRYHHISRNAHDTGSTVISRYFTCWPFQASNLRDRSRSGQFTYPTRNYAQLFRFQLDYFFTPLRKCVAYSLYGSMRINSWLPDDRFRTHHHIVTFRTDAHCYASGSFFCVFLFSKFSLQSS